MFKVNNKSIIQTLIILVFLLLTLNIFHTFFSVFIIDFEQVNVNWVIIRPQRLRCSYNSGYLFSLEIQKHYNFRTLYAIDIQDGALCDNS